MFIPRRTSEVLVSAMCLASIATVLIGIDTRVRDRFWRMLSTASTGDVSPFAEQLNTIGQSIIRVAEEHSIAQAPLLVFIAVALVLVLFMLRT